MTHRRGRAGDLESLAMFGALICVVLVLLAAILRRPKLWPLIALVVIVARCQGVT